MDTPKQDTSAGLERLLAGIGERVRRFLSGGKSTAPVAAFRQPFVLPEQKQRREEARLYAENPWEATLLGKAVDQHFGKKSGDLTVSRFWATSLQSTDAQVKDSALSMLKAYLAYHGVADTMGQLSSHTQMKLMIFSRYLSEGAIGKAMLYEAAMTLPLEQLVAFSAALLKDFSTLPAVAQVLLLKQLIMRRKDLKLDKKQDLDETQAGFKKLVRDLVVQFYGEAPEAAALDVAADPEKLRVGFLKIQPIEAAYREQLEEIERRYRLKLRQLKRSRSKKVAEAEEERLRRIEMVYDTVEGNLAKSLTDLTLTLDQVKAG